MTDHAVRRTSNVERAASLGCAVLSFGALVFKGSQFFPTPSGLLGGDYRFMLPHLLIGEQWIRQNGWLAPPYFTPAFCGGIPWLGNPQSIVYSLPQVLAVYIRPIQAFFATLVVAASAGAVGVYGLLRCPFRTSMCAATLGAVMFLLNGFLLYRLTIGHVTFHTFAVAPLLAWTALHPHQTNGGRIEWSLARRAVLGGCLLAYVTYGGGPHLIIPVVLTVAATILLWQLVYSFDNRPWATLALACFWSLPVAAMKLAPAAVLAAEFPRPYLPAFLFKNPLVFLKSLGLAFLAPELLPDYVSMGPDRATLGRHEYEFGLSFVPAVLLGLTFWRVDLKRVMLKHYVSGMVLAVLLATPLALTFGPTWWGRMLLSVPVIRNNTTLVRWWLIYIIPTIVGSALSFDWLVRTPKTRTLGLVAAVFVIVGQSTLRDVEYYSIPDPPYDPVAALEADRIIRAGGTLPSIKRIGQTQEFFAQRNAFLTGSAGARRFFSQNDAFLTGTSAWPCYDGLFGYYLELLPDPGLRFGSALEASPDGTLNLINPASFFKRSGGRAAVTRFAIGELPRAKDFASYRPIEGAEPPWQVVATWTTRWSAGGSVLILGWMALAVLARASRGHCELRGRARRGRRMAPEDR